MLTFILAIILTIIINRIYHNIFNVTYFGFMPMIKEIVVMFLISMFLVSAIL